MNELAGISFEWIFFWIEWEPPKKNEYFFESIFSKNKLNEWLNESKSKLTNWIIQNLKSGKMRLLTHKQAQNVKDRGLWSKWGPIWDLHGAKGPSRALSPWIRINMAAVEISLVEKAVSCLLWNKSILILGAKDLLGTCLPPPPQSFDYSTLNNRLSLKAQKSHWY